MDVIVEYVHEGKDQQVHLLIFCHPYGWSVPKKETNPSCPPGESHDTRQANSGQDSFFAGGTHVTSTGSL